MAPLTPPTDEELDLKGLFASLGRQWPWIVGGSCAGWAGAWIFLMGSPTIWEGEFQVVLASKEASSVSSGIGSLAQFSPMLANLAGIGGSKGELETEVKILESPSVLKPIYEQIKTRKALAGEPVANWDFADWASNLEIKLEKGTSILNVAYRDSDKSLILPVLNNISKAYQNYSGRERIESLRNGSIYLNQQVERLRAQAAESNRSLDAFRLRYGISASNGGFSGSGIDLSKLMNPTTSNNPLATLINPGASSSSSNSVTPVGGDPLGQLAAINQELIRRRSQFTDNDPSIHALIRERDSLRRYIETTVGGSLALPGREPTTQAEAQAIVLRFQELDRAAKRDSSTLNSLENSLLSLQLEQARAGKPWQLISTPTLQERPVSPRPTRTLAFGLLAGLLLGSGGALLVDRRSGRVFTPEELSEYLGTKLLATLRLEKPEQLRTNLSLISQGVLADCKNLGLIPVGLSSNDPGLNSIRDVLQQFLPAASIEVITSLSEATGCSHQLLVTSLGAPTRSQLQDLQQQLQLQTQSPCGWLLLDHNNAS